MYKRVNCGIISRFPILNFFGISQNFDGYGIYFILILVLNKKNKYIREKRGINKKQNIIKK